MDTTKLRKNLAEIKRLSYYRDSKLKSVEAIRNILLRKVINDNAFLFSTKDEYKTTLRREKLKLERLDNKIIILIKNIDL